MAFDHLSAERFISLVTFRGSGDPVATPVWFAHGVDGLGVGTFANSGKIKRIRRNGHAQIAPCNFRGLVKGPYIDVTANILEESEHGPAIEALEDKYGWQWEMFGRKIDTYLRLTARS